MCARVWKSLQRIRICRDSSCSRAVDAVQLSLQGVAPFPEVCGMPAANYLFTSESVAEGHPDKVCDRISDEIVDLFFREGPSLGFAAKDLSVACETMATTNRVIIAGETRGPKTITSGMVEEAARRAIHD